MKLRMAFFMILVCLSAIVFSCRREQPSLLDANRPPDTELWYAPPDSTEYEYLVHLYWRGLDADGLAVRYIWTIQDTLVAGPLAWNPSQRIADLRTGFYTTQTDTVISFTAFDDRGGVNSQKRRQAFMIAAIDDNGVIDPSPATVEFVATVDKIPTLEFSTTVRRVCVSPSGIIVIDTITTTPYDVNTPPDTVGMFRPFSISYVGKTTNGKVQGYRFRPLTAGIVIPGQDEWTPVIYPRSPDFPPDTIRTFLNGSVTGSDPLPSGTFRLSAQTRDDAGAQSLLDASRFTSGVVQIEVNFDPETIIFAVRNTYFIGAAGFEETIDFNDGIPDTVPYNSWIHLDYRGFDSLCDSSLCTDDSSKCMTYQYNYTQRSNFGGGGGTTTSRWLPDIPEDTNPGDVPDSTTMNVGSRQYTMRARSVDEYGRPDGTPAAVDIVGSFDPTLDNFWLENWDGTVIGDGDTITWDWWNPANYISSVSDTFQFTPEFAIIKKYWFTIRGTGHDHPKEPLGSGVKSWLYIFRPSADPSKLQKFARSGVWVDGSSVNVMDDVVSRTFKYSPVTDPGGSIRYAARASWFDAFYDFTIRGRDLANGDEFSQFVIVGSNPVKLNQTVESGAARRTATGGFSFYVTLDNVTNAP